MNQTAVIDEKAVGKPGDNSLTAAPLREPLHLIKKKLPLRVLSAADFEHWQNYGFVVVKHRTKLVLTEFPPLLLVLWREQHPEGHEQTHIDFNVRKQPAQSVPLNFELAKKD
jgi:hypothetical protein